MKNVILIFSFIIGVNISQAQEIIINDSLSLEFVKSKIVSKKMNARSNVKVKGKEVERIMVRYKIKALFEQPVDINSFFLLDTVNKIKYRLTEYIAYQKVGVKGAGYTSKMFLKENLLDKKGKPYKGLPKYDDSLEDSFLDYKFEGYSNVEFPINFGTNRTLSTAEAFSKKKDLVSAVYYSPTKMKQFTAELYFLIIEKSPGLILHYGYNPICNVSEIIFTD